MRTYLKDHVWSDLLALLYNWAVYLWPQVWGAPNAPPARRTQSNRCQVAPGASRAPPTVPTTMSVLIAVSDQSSFTLAT